MCIYDYRKHAQYGCIEWKWGPTEMRDNEKTRVAMFRSRSSPSWPESPYFYIRIENPPPLYPTPTLSCAAYPPAGQLCIMPMTLKGDDGDLFVGEEEDEGFVAGHQEAKSVNAKGTSAKSFTIENAQSTSLARKQRGAFEKKGTAKKVKAPRERAYVYVDVESESDNYPATNPVGSAASTKRGGGKGFDFLSEEESSDDDEESSFKVVREGHDRLKHKADEQVISDALVDRVKRVRFNPLVTSSKRTDSPLGENQKKGDKPAQIGKGRLDNAMRANIATAVKYHAFKDTGSKASIFKQPTPVKNGAKAPLSTTSTNRSSSPDSERRDARASGSVVIGGNAPNSPLCGSQRKGREQVQIGKRQLGEAIYANPTVVERRVFEGTKQETPIFKTPIFNQRPTVNKVGEDPLSPKSTSQSWSSDSERRDSGVSISAHRHASEHLLTAGQGVQFEDKSHGPTNDLALKQCPSVTECEVDVLVYSDHVPPVETKDITSRGQDHVAAGASSTRVDLRRGDETAASGKPFDRKCSRSTNEASLVG